LVFENYLPFKKDVNNNNNKLITRTDMPINPKKYDFQEKISQNLPKKKATEEKETCNLNH
jgi:hypothetical protein